MNKDLNLQKFIISVVLVGIVLVIGIYISSAVSYTTMTKNTLATKANESLGIPSVAGVTLTTGNSALDGVCGPVTEIYNATGVKKLGIGNISQVGCVIYNASTVDGYDINYSLSATSFKYTYTYTYTAASDASDAADDVVTALATGTSWISILVVVGFATIILTMLTSGLGAAAATNKYEGIQPYY